MAFETIVHTILKKGSERDVGDAYAVRDGTRWVPTNWSDYASQIRAAARGLIALGVESGMSVTSTSDWPRHRSRRRRACSWSAADPGLQYLQSACQAVRGNDPRWP